MGLASGPSTTNLAKNGLREVLVPIFQQPDRLPLRRHGCIGRPFGISFALVDGSPPWLTAEPCSPRGSVATTATGKRSLNSFAEAALALGMVDLCTRAI